MSSSTIKKATPFFPIAGHLSFCITPVQGDKKEKKKQIRQAQF